MFRLDFGYNFEWGFRLSEAGFVDVVNRLILNWERGGLHLWFLFVGKIQIEEMGCGGFGTW